MLSKNEHDVAKHAAYEEKSMMKNITTELYFHYFECVWDLTIQNFITTKLLAEIRILIRQKTLKC